MDKNTFGQLVMDNERQLYRIAKSILKNDEDCADAAQEAVKKAFEKLDTLREDRYAKTWLIKILIRVCYDLLAEQKKKRDWKKTVNGIKKRKTITKIFMKHFLHWKKNSVWCWYFIIWKVIRWQRYQNYWEYRKGQ